ncbi:SH3 domain-containing protein [Pseudomonas sp. LFM046]|uniref:SH3 domain-containing protein n=1 Tax=Pseudomonas sp. LFM046 TaxID=1608357 RepID=UPI0005CFB8B8|nr:SH3 domain-containing protein [Pseudomonas sp. LFM046]
MDDHRTITSLLGGTTSMRDLDVDTVALVLNSISRLSASLRTNEGAEKTLSKHYHYYYSDDSFTRPAQRLASAAIRQLLKNPKFHKGIEEAGGAPQGNFESTLAGIFAASISSESVDSFVSALTTRLQQDAPKPPTQHVHLHGFEATEFGTPTITTASPTTAQNPSVTVTTVTSPTLPIASNSIPTWVWFFLLMLLQVLVNWNVAREGLADILGRLPPNGVLAELRKELRVQLSGKPGDYRLVKGDRVNLRAGPSMKAEALIQLNKGDLVAVLGKEDRTWLNVLYKKDGVLIEGYMSTKYLKRTRP